MKYINWLRTMRRIVLNKAKDKRSSFQELEENSEINEIIDRVRTEGLFVYEGFFSSEECIEFKNQLDHFVEKESLKKWKDSTGADTRFFGIDRLSKLIKDKFYDEPRIVALRENFYRTNDENIDGFTMGNKIRGIKGNLGSGGGWHRDSVNKMQFKVILYLTDVNENNGPFQYLKGSQNKQSVLDGILEYNFKYNHNRLKNEDVENYMSTGKYELVTCVGKAGTLIIVDTSGIHRGKPILEDERYAFTNYYALSQKIGEDGFPPEVLDLLIEA